MMEFDQQLLKLELINNTKKTMSRNTQNINRKLQLQKTQIRSILTDFRKAKYKCIAISNQINVEMPKKTEFEALQKQIQVKLELLDAPGLVSLKGRLMKSLSQLFDIEDNLSTQKERRAARNQFKIIMNSNHNQNKNLQQSTQNSKEGIKQRQIKVQNEQRGNMMEKTSWQRTPKAEHNKVNAFNVPIYHIKEDSSQNKVERLSKYVASLKSTQQKQLGNMKIHAEDRHDEKIKDILHQIPEYLALKQELQSLKMQRQEIENKMRLVAKTAIQDYLKSAQVIQENQIYKVIKIYKKQGQTKNNNKQVIKQKDQNKRQQRKQIGVKPQKQPFVIPIQPVGPRRLKIAELQQQIQLIKSKRKDAQIEQIERELQKQQYNVQSVVCRINQTLQSNEQKLRRLREQRIKIFQKDQDIWSELQQL